MCLSLAGDRADSAPVLVVDERKNFLTLGHGAANGLLIRLSLPSLRKIRISYGPMKLLRLMIQMWNARCRRIQANGTWSSGWESVHCGHFAAQMRPHSSCRQYHLEMRMQLQIR